MTERKQGKQDPKHDPKLDQDLRHNPGIGQSKGAYAMGGDLDFAEGENTVEGDVAEDANAAGGISRERRGRDH